VPQSSAVYLDGSLPVPCAGSHAAPAATSGRGDAGSGRRGRGEELQGDAVGVAEGEARAIRFVFDSAVLDAQFIELARPLLELVAGGAAECNVVEADLELAEAPGGAGRWCWCRPSSVPLPSR
jgi:hypothetical protein